MDVIISTSVPYSPVWKKRGSKYLDDSDKEVINKDLRISGSNKIYAELTERVGTSVPAFCTEDLSYLIVTELNYNEIPDNNMDNAEIDIPVVKLPIIDNICN